jgi:DNA-binding response OmpR family regulator
MDRTNQRILVVEDDGPTCAAMEETLSAWGYEVDSVPDGGQALERIRSRHYDLAILDLMLPDSDGVLLRQKICSKSPHGTPRVLFTTGFTDQPAVVKYLQHSGNAFVAKPFRATELIEAVRSALAVTD